MHLHKEELEKKIEGVKALFVAENTKGVEHFRKFEEAIEGLAKTVTRAHDRVDTRAIENKVLTKRVVKLEEKCDVLTGQVRGVAWDLLMVANNVSFRWLRWCPSARG